MNNKRFTLIGIFAMFLSLLNPPPTFPTKNPPSTLPTKPNDKKSYAKFNKVYQKKRKFPRLLSKDIKQLYPEGRYRIVLRKETQKRDRFMVGRLGDAENGNPVRLITYNATSHRGCWDLKHVGDAVRFHPCRTSNLDNGGHVMFAKNTTNLSCDTKNESGPVTTATQEGNKFTECHKWYLNRVAEDGWINIENVAKSTTLTTTKLENDTDLKHKNTSKQHYNEWKLEPIP